MLVKQLALKNWKSASSTILQHKELLEDVQDKILKFKSSLEEQNHNLLTPNKENVAPTKRLLNMPQGNSPCHKAVRVNSPASKLSSRKSLSFARRENLPDEGDLQVKVAFVANDDLIARIPCDMPLKQIASKATRVEELEICFKHNITAQGASRRRSRQNPQRDVEGKSKDRPTRTPNVVFVVASHYQSLQIIVLLFVSLNIQLSYLLSLTRALVAFNVARVLCLNLNRIAMMHVA